VESRGVRWLAVDLPESIKCRQRFMPDTDRHKNFACSALDFRWLDEVDASRGVFITAAGLLYYFEEADVARLIGACADRFRGSEMMFDTVPRWLSRRTLRGLNRTKTYRVPPMPWGIDGNELLRIKSFHENVVELREVGFPNGRGLFFGVIAPWLERLPILRDKRPAMVVVRFKP
jgi:O-methyltransferase involved in polyketide biosynthesis